MTDNKDIIGKQFNEWTVLKDLGGGKLECRCSCNKVKVLDKYSVTHGKTKSCGHLGKFKPLKGQKFNHWTVIEDIDKDYALCECDCEKHTIKKVQKGHLKNGASKSCGCAGRGIENLVGKKFNHLTIIEELGGGKVKVECDCDNHTIKIAEKYSIKYGLIRSCGCKKTALMQKTMLETYGDVTANRASNPREDWQIEAVANEENFKHYINTFIGKPTIKQLSVKLDISESQVGRLINNYKLESYIEHLPNHSYHEDKLSEYVDDIYNGKIIFNDRHIIYPYELDIYIPEKRIAIEFNGSYWHSTLRKSKNYHQNKTIDCAKKGIHLIHIFEHEWVNEEEQRKIKAYLNLLLTNNKEVIFGRNTTVSEITGTEANEFCNKYHLQGSVNSKINIGIFNINKEMLGVMTFGVPRFNTNYEYELHRMCFKDNIVILDGTDRMFRYFINNYHPQSIVKYVDITKFTGNCYLTLGFKPVADKPITEPNYTWVAINSFKILSDNEAQEKACMQVFDSGNLKLEWIK